MLINSYMNTDLYEVLKHPGYYNMTHKYYHKDYFNKLAEYKGSMVGLADYPLNFLLGKVIEVIGSGCIGFFEKSPFYEEKLGLKPWIHYVPVERNKYNKLILEDVSYRDLLQSDSGKKQLRTSSIFFSSQDGSRISRGCKTQVIPLAEGAIKMGTTK